jgi:hypothetical protein
MIHFHLSFTIDHVAELLNVHSQMWKAQRSSAELQTRQPGDLISALTSDDFKGDS